MEKGTYFGYKLKDGTNLTDVVLKIKEETLKIYNQEVEETITKIVMKITNKKSAGYKEALNDLGLSYKFNERLNNIYNKIDIFRKSKIDNCLINLYQLSNGKILFKTVYDDSLIFSNFAILLEGFIKKNCDFVECYTDCQDVLDEIIPDAELEICTKDWEEAYSLSEDKVKIIKLLDDENSTIINFKNIEKIIEYNFEKRLNDISTLKLNNTFESENNDIEDFF